jgi:threonylcarbamoyladenosine tRNA methylthiotransferase MtaB
MRTFAIETLGCKVNQYESEQLAVVLRQHGLIESDPSSADLRIVNTCSVTIQAASKSRQTARRKSKQTPDQKTIVTGCWATSDKAQAANIPGVDAVLTHHDDVAKDLDRLLTSWGHPKPTTPTQISSSPPEPFRNDGWMRTGEFPAASDAEDSKASSTESVKQKIAGISLPVLETVTPQQGDPLSPSPQYAGERVGERGSVHPWQEPARTGARPPSPGTTSLPLLDSRQSTHQRAFLKIQDGCDAHCTYCIIPQLRPRLWSKPVADAIAEAKRLVAAGHQELVLTGIFLSAYGQPTALRRRQSNPQSQLAQLLTEVCESVPNLRRIRLSSLEPGDLTPDLIAVLRDLPQVVPHFHVPLQSGSDAILRRMNRQYTRDNFLEMVDHLHDSFDRPALTTDIIVGFPGESDGEFAKTLQVVDHARFIHIHAFPFSPRPGTAAARWKNDFIHGPVVNDRLNALRLRAVQYSEQFRQQFLGETVDLLVEMNSQRSEIQHGRCARYFDVHFESNQMLTGRAVQVRVDRITSSRTHGTLLAVGGQR